MAATMAAGGKAKTRRLMLEQQKAYQKELEEKRVDEWMDKYDANGNGLIDLDEFKSLIRGLNDADGLKVDDVVIERLFTKAANTTSETPDELERDQLRDTVVKYREYMNHQDYLNALMNKFDTDGSGTLDRAEIKVMLETILRDGAKLTVNSQGREYKLKALEDAYRKGLLDNDTYMLKLHRVQGGPESGATKWQEITDDDVEFVIKEADADGNGELDREEVMASLALWTKLLKSDNPVDEAKGSGLCSIM